MLDALNRAERYRDMAEGCRRLPLSAYQPRLETTICGWPSITARWPRPRSKPRWLTEISRQLAMAAGNGAAANSK